MKKLILYIAGAVTLSLPACKTTEANYRAAYETAKERNRSGDLDSTVYARIRQEARPSAVKVGSDTLPLVTQNVKLTPIEGVEAAPTLRRYNLVVAQFKQIFNARSMRMRLVEAGYPDALIVETREPLYYVVAASYDNAAAALKGLNDIKAAQPLVLREPFPWILQPASFAR